MNSRDYFKALLHEGTQQVGKRNSQFSQKSPVAANRQFWPNFTQSYATKYHDSFLKCFCSYGAQQTKLIQVNFSQKSLFSSNRESGCNLAQHFATLQLMIHSQNFLKCCSILWHNRCTKGTINFSKKMTFASDIQFGPKLTQHCGRFYNTICCNCFLKHCDMMGYNKLAQITLKYAKKFLFGETQLYISLFALSIFFLNVYSMMGCSRQKKIVLVSFDKKSLVGANRQCGPNLAQIYTILYLMIGSEHFF